MLTGVMKLIGPKLVARCANKMCSDKRNAAKTEDKSVTDHL